MAKQVNKSLFDDGTPKPKLSDKIELEKPSKKNIAALPNKVEIDQLTKKVYADRSVKPLSNEERKRLFPNVPPPTMKQLKDRKNKK